MYLKYSLANCNFDTYLAIQIHQTVYFYYIHRHISADEIVCKLYDLRLDVFDGHCYNGGRVGCCRRTGNSNQRWHFEGIIFFLLLS